MIADKFQSLDPEEVGKRVGCEPNLAGEIGDPIRIVMTTRKCGKKEAIAWLENEFGKSDENLVLLDDDTQRVKLAQDFVRDTAMLCVGLYANKKGRVIEQAYIVTSKPELFPCTWGELSKRGICYDRMPFPSVRWPLPSVRQFINGATPPKLSDCYAAILQHANYYLDLGDPEMMNFLALWIMGTYCFRLFHSYPYIHLNGNAECGKTKVLEFISLLSFNGEMMSSDTSPAAMLRSIDANCSTFCIDEVEGLQNARDDDARSVLAVLNTGYKLGGGDKKCEKVGKSEQWIPVFYDGYCPKVLAGIKSIAHTLQTRCVPILMIRSTNKDVLNRSIEWRDPLWPSVRSMLYPSILHEWKTIEKIYQNIKSITLTGREWELWKPIITLAAAVDESGALANCMRELASEVQKRRKEIDTGALSFLRTLLAILEQDQQQEAFYSTTELYDKLSEEEEEEFGWLQDMKFKSARGKWLGNELRRNRLVDGKAKLRSIGGKKVKGYILSRTQIELLLSAYGDEVTKSDSSVSGSDQLQVTLQ